jgi:hypothetical protein
MMTLFDLALSAAASIVVGAIIEAIWPEKQWRPPVAPRLPPKQHPVRERWIWVVGMILSLASFYLLGSPLFVVIWLWIGILSRAIDLRPLFRRGRSAANP